MLFNWETALHGPCLVNSCASHGVISVIIAWGKEVDGCSLEYRIAHLACEDERKRLDHATRLAMWHFDHMQCHQTGLINLAIDSTSQLFTGPMPEPLE